MDSLTLIDKSNQIAWSNGQVATLCHVMISLIQGSTTSRWAKAKASVKVAQTALLPNLTFKIQSVEENALSFDPGELCRFLNNRHQKSRGVFQSDHDCALAALLDLTAGGPEDGSREAFVKICTSHNFIASNLEKGGPEVISTLGFGTWIKKDRDLPPLYGRVEELKRHSGLLKYAFAQQIPYLISGEPGVGKSVFVNHLIRTPVTSGFRLAQISPEDILNSKDAIRESFSTLFSFLLDNLDVVLVLDDLDKIIANTSVATAFEEELGSFFRSPRASIVVCESGALNRIPSLNSVRPFKLGSLSNEFTQKIIEDRITSRKKYKEFAIAKPESTKTISRKILATCDELYGGIPQPKGALNILEGSIIQSRLRSSDGTKLSKTDVDDFAVVDLGLNPEVIGKDKRTIYTELRTFLKTQVFGQDHIINQISQVLFSRAIVPTRHRPRGRFLFAGPPGTGKTHLAKSLAQGLGYGKDAFYEFSMGEFSGDGARNRFIGADPGYKQSMESFTIFDAVKESPACVILLDEIDRADAQIQDILLGLLEGRGRDAMGNEHRFNQAIFIMTTNQGQEQIEDSYNQHARDMGREVLANRLAGIQHGVDTDKRIADLRSLLISRSASAGESRIIDYLSTQMNEICELFSGEKNVAIEETATFSDQLAQRYTDLKRSLLSLQYDNHKTALDRALLDRVDFIFPFFPLEKESLRQILDYILKVEKWNKCKHKKQIVDRAFDEQERGRAIVRLVEQFKQQDAEFRLGESVEQ